MSRAESPVVSRGRLAAKEAARAKRTLNPTQRQANDRRTSPSEHDGASGPVASTLPSNQGRTAPRDALRAPRSLPGAARRPAVRRRHDEDITPARVGDPPAIYQALLAIFQGPSRDEFHALEDRPGHDVANRLLVKREGRIVSHVEIAHRTMHFGPVKLPVGNVAWLGTLPEYRGLGYASRLLHRAEQQMSAAGAVLAVLRTKAPHFFRRAGWAVCGRQSYSVAKARDVLARLAVDRDQPRLPLSLRLWRHVELPSLMRIYAQHTANAYGRLGRSEEYWRWLASRKAFDHIIVAIHGRDRMELVDTNAPIVGYAVVRQDRIVELLASPEYPTTARQLLARACGDAIEHNRQNIIAEMPPEEPLHQLMVEAGGLFNRSESDAGEVLMAKVLDHARFVTLQEGVYAERAEAAGLPPSFELGFATEGRKRLFSVSKRGARWTEGRLGRSYLTLTETELTRLLMGHGDLAEAVAQGRIAPSTQTALAIAEAIFPRLPLWQPSWDDLPA